ncbi:MAG: molecular chaperone DnaK [Deltaproteobacteria bacterium]|nr:MAG: molecular chaperone DnaK [Deltaproteobacteria bacterium]
MSLAIGIDLGTTNSVAALATPRGVVVTQGPNGERVHPSVVSFPAEGGVLVGHEARARRAVDPQHTIYSAKRLIGQNMKAPLVGLALASLPYAVEEGPNQQPIIMARGRRMTVPEVSALVLGHLRKLTEAQHGDEVDRAVITVPANFSDAQRRATREAGVIAGLDVLRLVNEPTAAALAYGYAQRLDEHVAVFDFGGGTFDVSILKIRGDIFEVIATGGDFFLGGDDIDRALAELLAAELTTRAGADPRGHRGAMTRLMMAAEQIKCHLSSNEVAEGTIGGLIVGDDSTPYSLPFRITRQQFENLVSGYIDRTAEVCQQVLTSSGLEPAQISDVLCVGGSTRIPAVRARVADIFQREPAIDIDPDEVVAHGAAVQAAILTGNTAATENRALLLDVTPATLAVGTAGGYVERLLEKNAPIPIERTKMFTTARDYQTRVVIDVCRGESRRFADNEPLGTITLDNLPSAPRGETRIEVTFRVDADGILHVRARDERTGAAQEIHLNVIGAPSGESATPAPDAPAPA